MSVIREPDAEPIPGYRLIEPLGSGGFGEVWKCEAPGGLHKAIKFVYGNLNSLDVDGARAEQELKALNRIKEVRHPFVCSLDRIEVVGGELVIVMELADKSLHDLFVECQNAGLVGIPRDDLFRYLRDAAEALDHMNEKHGLQHLDIKPRNLFLISDRVKVADFGLVKHLERQSGSGLLGGVTPLYAPPETYQGKISERSDQYSLAIVYQELLTGQRPFSGKNVRQLAQQHLEEEPDLRVLPEAERPVVARALSKDPAKRFPNCLGFIRGLYTARMQAKPELLREPDAAQSGQHVRSLRDTMEDFQLEQSGGDGASEKPPAEEESDEVRHGMTVAQPDTGAIRPTIIIGVGNFGRKALVELRCRFVDRFADLSKLPLFRFLYVDTDAEEVKQAVRGTPEVALARSEVYHLPLQPVGHYRRRMLDHLTEWLPREKLYSVPRSLQTQGSRALGRLAFTDNHLRFLAWLKREIQHVTHPDTLYQSVTETGLALRDSVPRIFVIAPAGGGSSGFLVDLGYALRRLLQQLRHAEAEATLLLFCGTPNDPATPPAEQANVYATLTEVNHFSDPAVPFAAQYGADGPRILDQGQPFSCAYLLQMANRTPEALRDAVAHLGSYLFHELTTPLGIRLERSRKAAPGLGGTWFRSFGTYAVWFPRGLLLRLAAREACQNLLEDWMAVGEPNAEPEIEAACASILADTGVRPEALAARVEALAHHSDPAGKESGGNGKRSGVHALRVAAQDGWLDRTPAEALTAMLSALEEQSLQAVALDDPGNWARQALTRVREWTGAGSGANVTEWKKSRLGRALAGAAEKLAEEWHDRLAGVARGVMEHPGRRLAAGEAALQRFVQFCEQAAAAQNTALAQQAPRTEQAWRQLERALEACLAGPGSFSIFGNRSRRQLRLFLDHLAAYARQRLTEEIIGAVKQCYVLLLGRLQDQLRDLTFCRQRLRHLKEALESGPQEELDPDALPGQDSSMAHSPPPSTESFWESIRQSATAHVVLPDGESDLERAAARFLGRLTSEQWTQLDQALQDKVLGQLGGLQAACQRAGDLSRHFAAPLVDEAVQSLDGCLPVTDVAQVEMIQAASAHLDIEEQVRTYYERATPLLVSRDPATQDAYLLAPASESGKAFGATAEEAVRDLQLVRVPGQAHLTVCREQGYLSAEDLQRLLRPCRRAYEELAFAPTASPHARFDITDWVPLDP
jgi:eukaryotic-like serine/threonine-protein kinase